MISLEKKIIKIGNSLGIVIPYVFLEELDVSHSDIVDIEYNSTLNAITIRNKSTMPIEDDLEIIVKNIVDKYLENKNL